MGLIEIIDNLNKYAVKAGEVAKFPVYLINPFLPGKVQNYINENLELNEKLQDFSHRWNILLENLSGYGLVLLGLLDKGVETIPALILGYLLTIDSTARANYYEGGGNIRYAVAGAYAGLCPVFNNVFTFVKINPFRKGDSDREVHHPIGPTLIEVIYHDGKELLKKLSIKEVKSYSV